MLFAWGPITLSQTTWLKQVDHLSNSQLTALTNSEVRAGFGLNAGRAKDGCRFAGGGKSDICGASFRGGSK